jgi:hypothetical protein
MTKKKKTIEDVCLPVPQNLSLSRPSSVESNDPLKKHLFRQTLQTAYRVEIPYRFTTSYNPEKPHALVTEEQIEMVAALFQALQPQDAVEAALAQQFIIVHIQAIEAAHGGIGEIGIKKFELSHQILETLTKYRTKGAQFINVQYNHNQGQINNIKIVKEEKEPTTVEIKPNE